MSNKMRFTHYFGQYRISLTGILISVFFLTTGCRHKQYLLSVVTEVDVSAMPEIELQGTDTGLEIIGVREIGIIDNFFVAATTDPAGQIKLFDKETLKELAVLCPEGRSRSDLIYPMLQPLQLVNKHGAPTLVIVDNNSFIKSINLKESVMAGHAVVDTILETFAPVDGCALDVGDGKWLDYHGIYYDDPRDNVCTSPTFIVRDNQITQEIPLFGDIMNTEAVAWTASFYIGLAVPRPSGGKAVFAMYVLDYLNIFDVDSMTVKTIHNSRNVTIDEPTGINFIRNIPLNYSSVAATDDLIVTITWDFSNNQWLEDPDLPVHVRIWNWNGDLVARYHMDRFLRGIAYDKEKMIIYGLDPIDEVIYSYDISTYISAVN